MHYGAADLILDIDLRKKDMDERIQKEGNTDFLNLG